MSYYFPEFYEYIIIYSYLKHVSRLANLHKKHGMARLNLVIIGTYASKQSISG